MFIFTTFIYSDFSCLHTCLLEKVLVTRPKYLYCLYLFRLSPHFLLKTLFLLSVAIKLIVFLNEKKALVI